MDKAIDPKTGDRVRPNPGARAKCPYCFEPMTGKCGAVVYWHWAHIGPPCRQWETAFHGPQGGATRLNTEGERGTCATCRYGLEKCYNLTSEARRWIGAWEGQAGRPHCPGYATGDKIDPAALDLLPAPPRPTGSRQPKLW